MTFSMFIAGALVALFVLHIIFRRRYAKDGQLVHSLRSVAHVHPGRFIGCVRDADGMYISGPASCVVRAEEFEATISTLIEAGAIYDFNWDTSDVCTFHIDVAKLDAFIADAQGNVS